MRHGVRIWFASGVAKLCYQVLRRLGKKGTALPGLVLLKLAPNFIKEASKGLRIVLVSGTNGKTTTTHLLADILEQTKASLVSNRSGSNLSRGIAWTLLLASQEKERLRKLELARHFSNSETPTKPINQTVWAVLECDEAALPKVALESNPELILLLNIFRDQIDRYGEVDVIAGKWRSMLEKLQGPVEVVANADDPAVAYATLDHLTTVYFGNNDPSLGKTQLQATADALLSPIDGTRLIYEKVFYSHLGWYASEDQSFGRPRPHYFINKMNLRGLKATSLTVQDQSGKQNLDLEFKLPGIYNAYNLLAATTAALRLEIGEKAIKTAVNGFEAAFGRLEQLELDSKTRLTVALAKNPTGFDQVIELLASSQFTEPYPGLMIGINDLVADGQDISWLWDTNFESFVSWPGPIIATGTRSSDLALRLLYAGIEETRIHDTTEVMAALNQAQALNPAAKEIFAILSYTALLDLRQQLEAAGTSQPMYKAEQKAKLKSNPG